MRTMKGRNMNNSPRSLRHAVRAALEGRSRRGIAQLQSTLDGLPAGVTAGRVSALRRFVPAPVFDKQIRKINRLAV